MKTFTKIAFLLITALAANKAQAQCTPNTTMEKGTILPEAIKFGYINNAYSEVIYFRAPLDTTAKTPLGTFPAHIDSMEITGVKGLPAGFTYTCYNNKCRIKGGESSCITLSGTATVEGVHPVTVYITTYATIKGFVDIPATQNDSNNKYTLYIYTNVGVKNESLGQFVTLYPNPAKDALHISNSSAKNIQAKLMDLTGKLIAEKEITTSETFDLSGLSKGLYFVRLSSGSEVSVQKIAVE
ncbi:MAG: T9SS type A sorting domain-containing protein [Bacteroidota bacterium]